AAAEEGVLCGIRSIALSRVGWFADGGSFAAAVEYVADNLTYLYDNCKPYSLLNINVPNLPLSQASGVKVCPLNTSRIFFDRFERVENDMWRISGERAPLPKSYDDITLSEEGFITITPVSVLRTDYDLLEKLEGADK
ncbi:MAG: 5'/3'-nucleotidase SurE, partial [Firmicutes bacterium]|nr:5'/3'-nucleotidase SurE [Bacillota bacterium]